MDVIRRNTDYALRLMLGIASAETMVSAKKLSADQDVPYQLACKLLQKLHGGGFLQSKMGAKGGFMLAKKACEISLADVIVAIQGPLSLNKCMLGKDQCPKQFNCQITKKLAGLQNYIEGFLTDVTLDQLSENLNSEKGSANNG